MVMRFTAYQALLAALRRCPDWEPDQMLEQAAGQLCRQYSGMVDMPVARAIASDVWEIILLERGLDHGTA